MLRAITIRPVALGRSGLDIGELAEALLFYGSTRLVLTSGDLADLVRLIGVDTVVSMTENGKALITVLRDSAATLRAADGTYDFITTEILHSNQSARSDIEIVADSFEGAGVPRGRSRRAASRFLRVNTVGSVNEGVFAPNGVPEFSRMDLDDPAYVRSGVEIALRHLLRGPIPADWHLEVTRVPNGFEIASDLNFSAITGRHRAIFGGSYEISPALLLDFLNQARVDMILAARFQSDLLSSPLTADIVGLRLGRPWPVQPGLSPALGAFQEQLLEGRQVAEVVRSGQRSFSELLALVDRAQPLKKWLLEQPLEADLLREYYKSVTAGTWVERQPGKTLRFLVCTGVSWGVEAAMPGGIGMLVGGALAAADAFLLDRFMQRWRPNQFVERRLFPFVATDPTSTPGPPDRRRVATGPASLGGAKMNRVQDLVSPWPPAQWVSSYSGDDPLQPTDPASAVIDSVSKKPEGVVLQVSQDGLTYATVLVLTDSRTQNRLGDVLHSAVGRTLSEAGILMVSE